MPAICPSKHRSDLVEGFSRHSKMDNTPRHIQLMKTILIARKNFSESLVSHKPDIELATTKGLRNEAVQQICEFFFLLQENGIRSDNQICNLAEGHNRLTEATLNDPEKLERLGKKPSAMEKGLFTQLGIEKLVENFRRRPPCFDQSDLNRLLVSQMAPESCNRAIKIMEQAGLIESFKSPYGSKIIHSPGIIEGYFRDYISGLDNSLEKFYSTGGLS